MKVFVDDTCTVCGLCAAVCPQVFDVNDETATVIVDVVPPEAEASCREAVESCPVEAIRMEE